MYCGHFVFILPYVLITQTQPPTITTPTHASAELGGLSRSACRPGGGSAQAQFPPPSGVFLFPGIPCILAGGRGLFLLRLWQRHTRFSGPLHRRPLAPGQLLRSARLHPQQTHGGTWGTRSDRRQTEHRSVAG